MITIILSHKALEMKRVKDKYKVKPTYFESRIRTRHKKFAVVSWQGKEMCVCGTSYLANKIKRLLNDETNQR